MRLLRRNSVSQETHFGHILNMTAGLTAVCTRLFYVSRDTLIRLKRRISDTHPITAGCVRQYVQLGKGETAEGQERRRRKTQIGFTK